MTSPDEDDGGRDGDDPCEGLDEVIKPVEEVMPVTEHEGGSRDGEAPSSSPSWKGGSDLEGLDEVVEPVAEVRPVQESDVIDEGPGDGGGDGE